MRERGVKKTATSKGSSKTKVRAKANGPTKVKAASKPPPAGNSIELPEGMWERIAKKAYELYEQRGRSEGRALQDWLEAEEIIMEEIHESRQ
jgi:hypothetical protein